LSRFKFLEFTDSKKKQASDEQAVEYTADYYYGRGREQFVKGYFEDALRLFSRTLEEDNKFIEAWAYQAWSLIYLDELPEALVWTNRALERFPDSPELLSLKGLLLAMQGELEEGMAFSDGAISQEKSVSESVWLARGEILLRGGGGNERHCFLRAIDVKPKNAVVLVRIAQSYLVCGYSEKALPYLNKAINLPFEGHWLWLVLARCHERMGDVEKSLQYYRSVIRTTPDLEEARLAFKRLQPRGLIDRFIVFVHRMVGGKGGADNA